VVLRNVGILPRHYTASQPRRQRLKSLYNLMLSRRVSIMKFSRVISRVSWFSLVETNVSKTISVLVLFLVTYRCVILSSDAKHFA
jgi:hypothetical protein